MVSRSQVKGIQLKCPSPKCGYAWVYRGTMKVHCICPDCRGVVTIARDKV